MSAPSPAAAFVAALPERFRAELASELDAAWQLDLTGEGGGRYWIRVADGACTTGEGEAPDAGVTLRASAEDWLAIADGRLDAQIAYLTHRLEVAGDVALALRTRELFL